MKECNFCQENENGILYHILTSKDNKQITICDYCYQELSILKKINNTWVEYVTVDSVEYYKN